MADNPRPFIPRDDYPARAADSIARCTVRGCTATVAAVLADVERTQARPPADLRLGLTDAQWPPNLTRYAPVHPRTFATQEAR